MGKSKAKQNNSPCIDVCEFSAPHGWCVGCGRTRQECKQWKGMKPYARNALLSQLKKRLSRLEG
ncbi:MAG: DUF1289 domain-containing protein [Pseudomonadales bacterium]|nr:DUF1289 domain-containing protein [Pseudomonadales bacterium]